MEDLQSAFPGIEVQLQLRDLIEAGPMREHFKKHFRAFLHFMEEEEPALAKHTGYMKKMHKHILKVGQWAITKESAVRVLPSFR